MGAYSVAAAALVALRHKRAKYSEEMPQANAEAPSGGAVLVEDRRPRAVPSFLRASD